MSEPMRGRTLLELIESHANRTPDAAAILAPGRTPLTYGALRREIAAVAQALAAAGVSRHDRVAIVMPDGPEMAVACLGVMAAATCAPLNPASHAREFDAQFDRLECRALLVLAGETSPAVAIARTRGIAVIPFDPGSSSGRQTFDDVQPGDVALVLQTSGTAARPKVVPLTHGNLHAAAANISAALDLSPHDRSLGVMPLFHIHGLSALFASMASGGSLVCPGGFSAQRFYESLEESRPTWYTAAPTMHREVLEHAAQYARAVARSSLRFIRSASAPMPPTLIAGMERVFGVPFVEAYGMTEAAPQIASNRLSPAGRKPGSVGRAAGPDVAIVNGEVVIRGANVMAGYAGDPEATRDAFVDGWFRTGDLGHLDAHGFLFITGRVKEIVNRGGEKISPREVDDVLLAHPAIAQAVTFPVPHPTLGEDVAAAVVLGPSAPAMTHDELVRALREFASARLADFKVPQLIVVVDAIPTETGGKVPRLDLAERLGLLTPGRRSEFVAPRTPLEARLTSLCAGVLGVARLGVHDNFFQSGGDSIKAAQVLSEVGVALQIELPVNALFQHPTVAELADAIARDGGRSRGDQTPIPHRPASEPAPLSFAQQRLWILDQLEPGNPAYNMCAARRLSGPLSLDALERSLSEIVRRHETLRTTVRAVGGQPVQIVSPAHPMHVPVVDLSRVAAAGREAEALRLASEDAGRPFHLVHGPLFRATLLKLDAEDHLLLLTVHHIVSDGWSTGVLLRELDALYAAYTSGGPSPLPALPIQYRDFAAWQRDRLHGDAIETQLAYWKAQLEGMPPVLELPADRPRPDAPAYRGASYAMDIPGELIARLNVLGQREDATPFMTLITAFQALLLRYTGQTGFGVGTPIASRGRAETEGLIGLFANTLVMRADLSDNPSFRAALRRTRATALDAYAHQDVPFEKLVEELHPERDHRHNPLFQVMFAYQNLPDHGPAASWPGVTVTPVQVTRPNAKFDLTIYLTESAKGLSATWQYNTDLFDEPRIARMAGHFRTLLDAIAATPDATLSELPLLTLAERHELLTAWNPAATAAEDDRAFHLLFEEQTRLHPDAPAVRCGRDRLTYRELNARANQLARRLQRLGAGAETRVGVLVTRSTSAVVAVLAVMKAGGTFVPMDPSYPADHVTFVMDDAQTALVVTDQFLDAEAGAIAAESAANLDTRSAPSHLAYVLYTSGSTGRPKGVMITHANVSHYVHAMRATLGVKAGDRYLHTASFAFSSSVRQLTVPLSCGACVVLARPETIRDPQALFELITQERVSIIDLVPSHWRMCQEALAGLPPEARDALLDNELRLILSASEPLPSELTREWALAFRHGARLVNMFGQTETTGIVTTYSIPAGGAAARVVPIGRPIPHTQAYVLDPLRQPVPIGVWGELYIGGAGVGRGYLNDPDLTAERFVSDPFSTVDGARLYRTGDVVRRLPDGDLEFSGRLDHQMKVRGYRIEPGQVEAVINQLPAWRESAVTAEEDAGVRRLVAYVVHDARVRSSARELRAVLRQKLPEYMVPTRIVELAALPRTPNGKVNWGALAAEAVAEADVHAEREPETLAPLSQAQETLSAIWADVLGMSRVNPDDNFFDIGGNSILAMAMITRAHEAGLGFTPRQLWMHQTIAELATVVTGAVAPEMVARTSHRRETTAAADVVSGGQADSPERVRVTLESLRAYGHEALVRAGLSPEGAAIVTDVQLEASLRDQPTHNMVSIPRYATRITNGTINARPNIRVESETGTSAQIDGDNGPGQWVAVVAMDTAMRIARQKGVGVVAVRRSNHLGAAGHYPWLAAREGLIGLCTTTGPVILAPTGGTTPTFGNNPIGVGIPAKCHHPILLDIAMSVAPRGRIGLALAEGKTLPKGWILDRQGRPSTDPADLVAGLGMPIGGHKGYGLTLIMEVLAGVLTGAGFGWDNRREHNRHMVKPANFGHFFMAIDPELFMALPDFTARVDRLIDQTKSGERAEGADEILIPGESELRARERSLKEGVPLRPSTYDALRKYGAKAGLDTELAIVHHSRS